MNSEKKRNIDWEEAGRAILAALLLIAIASIAIVWPIIHPEGSAGAVALDIQVSRATLSGVQQEVLVKAVNASGVVDSTRNDTVRISIESEEAVIRSQSSLNREWSKEVTINLDQGVGRVELFTRKSESITLTATWLEGGSPLQSRTVSFHLMRLGPETPEPPP